MTFIIILNKTIGFNKKKPIIKIENLETTQEVSEEIEEASNIYPKKKPVIFQKKVDKAAAKSLIASTENSQLSSSIVAELS